MGFLEDYLENEKYNEWTDAKYTAPQEQQQQQQAQVQSLMAPQQQQQAPQQQQQQAPQRGLFGQYMDMRFPAAAKLRYQQQQDQQDAADEQKQNAAFGQTITDPQLKQAWESGVPGVRQAIIKQQYADPSKTMSDNQMFMQHPEQYKNKYNFEQSQKQFAPSDSEQPNAVREWNYFNKLNDEDKTRYLGLKRSDKMVDRGTHTLNTRTGEEYDKNIIEKKVQEGYGTSVSQRLEGYNDYTKQSAAMEYETDRIMSDLNELSDMTNNWTTGIGGTLLKQIPQTAAKDWEERKTTVLSSMGLDKMMQLKAASPTGSTGFGALNAKELEVLQTHIASLNQAQSPRAIQGAIHRINKHLGRIKSNILDDRKRSEVWYKKNSRNQDTNRGGRYDQTEGPMKGVKWK